MTFNPKQYEEIFLNSLQDAYDKGLISNSEEFINYIKSKKDISNFYVMNLSVDAKSLEDAYVEENNVYLVGSPLTATGKDLDKWGKLINCPRPQATHAGVEINFSLRRSLNEDVSEPAGILISSTTGIVYKTVEELYFPKGETECTVYALSVEAGVEYSVIENTLTKIVSNVDNIPIGLSCNNSNVSSRGSRAYTDEEYRDLILNWIEINLKGSGKAYHNYFASADGIDGYSVVPNWDGSGTVKIIVDPGDSYTLNRIYDDLNNNVTQETEDIVLMPPILKTVDIYVTCNTDIDRLNPYSTGEKELISAKIKSVITTFINGGFLSNGDYHKGMVIGEDFIPHKLGVFLDKEVIELKNIVFSNPTQPVAVNNEEKCVAGEIIINME